jgi:hypothetical protein
MVEEMGDPFALAMMYAVTQYAYSTPLGDR